MNPNPKLHSLCPKYTSKSKFLDFMVVFTSKVTVTKVDQIMIHQRYTDIKYGTK